MKNTARKNYSVSSRTSVKWLQDPEYPPGEDIYSMQQKVQPGGEEKFIVKAKDDLSSIGDDLDVPGEELDDKDELIGEEDEANNYYSLGSDNHNDLYERQDD